MTGVFADEETFEGRDVRLQSEDGNLSTQPSPNTMKHLSALVSVRFSRIQASTRPDTVFCETPQSQRVCQIEAQA
jgi:hypothetical protein